MVVEAISSASSDIRSLVSRALPKKVRFILQRSIRDISESQEALRFLSFKTSKDKITNSLQYKKIMLESLSNKADNLNVKISVLKFVVAVIQRGCRTMNSHIKNLLLFKTNAK